MPVEDAAFIVHWLNNKEMAFTSKVDRISRRPQSMLSLSSGNNEEMLASYVCVEERSSPDPEGIADFQSYDFGEYLRPGSPKVSVSTPQRDLTSFVLDKKKEAQLTEEWINSPDLLVCIHPNTGSLMVWTMEGLDTPKHITRLNDSHLLPYVHVLVRCLHVLSLSNSFFYHPIKLSIQNYLSHDTYMYVFSEKIRTKNMFKIYHVQKSSNKIFHLQCIAICDLK